MNQDEVAARIGVSRTLLSKIETAKSPYSQRTLEALAGVYGCDPADLLSIHPVEKISGEQEITTLLKRIKVIPDGEAWRAYRMIMSQFAPADAQPSQTPPRDPPQGESPRRGSKPSRKQAQRSDA